MPGGFVRRRLVPKSLEVCSSLLQQPEIRGLGGFHSIDAPVPELTNAKYRAVASTSFMRMLFGSEIMSQLSTP